MTPMDQSLLRVAIEISSQLNMVTDRGAIWLPEQRWLQLVRLRRRYELARQRKWHHAANLTFNQLQHVLKSLQQDLLPLNAAIEATPRMVTASAREILADLRALQDEFEDVTIDRKQKEIAVTTESICLQNIDLGRFEIRLNYANYSDDAGQYQVIALEPNPACSNDSVTHPHVQDEDLCEGEGHATIDIALRQGRLYDFFTIVANLLRTYNDSSPYVALSAWQAVNCMDCGHAMDADEGSDCEKCDTPVCEDCSVTCPDCHRNFCCGCTSECEGCSERFCHSCLITCADCDADFCSSCLTNERCEYCDEQQNEEKTESTTPIAAVQSDGLGEAAVSA
ncbi:hypothetical protein [Rubinisphaera margarita]|uniref:hypothetical protein n=1 Tax=Rubinisphaera margarita TaxID=2909586 RepID=UPI001EE8DFD1|nr:hypothetical protein [Rubinisphaera margarita]MCG6157261.1 hypothetical protein [Rubinisphaera margarita]